MTDRPPDPRLDHQILRQAASWLARLHPGAEPPPEAFLACERWRAERPDHERAWQLAQQLHAQFATLPPALARPTLQRQRARRKALAAIGAFGVALPAAWLAWRLAPTDAWRAQYRTGTGERRELQLADGSTVLMNAASAVDVAYDARARMVQLHTGEILVRIAPESQASDARPFLVKTAAGRVRGLDAHFMVRQRSAQCHVIVLRGAVEVTPRDGTGQRLRVVAGKCLIFTASHAVGMQPAVTEADAWSRGVLMADDMRLADFLEALSYYRPGWLQCDPAVAGLRLSGGFQLHDTDKVLALLPSILPVRIVRRTRYWVVVEPRHFSS